MLVIKNILKSDVHIYRLFLILKLLKMSFTTLVKDVKICYHLCNSPTTCYSIQCIGFIECDDAVLHSLYYIKLNLFYQQFTHLYHVIFRIFRHEPYCALATSTHLLGGQILRKTTSINRRGKATNFLCTQCFKALCICVVILYIRLDHIGIMSYF